MDPKAGYLSTEFWTTLLVHVAAIASLFLDVEPMVSVAALAAAGVSQALYSLSRSQAKVASTQAAAQVVSTQAAVAQMYEDEREQS
jgi:hypothetical protein